MELMFSNSKKVAFSQREEWKSSKYQSHPKKLLLQILWVSCKREDVRNSLKLSKTLKKAILRPMMASRLTDLVKKCFKSMDCKKIQLTSLDMQLLSIPMIASYTSLQLSWSEKSNCIWTQWEKIPLLSSIQSSDWEVFLKDFQESVQWMAGLLCWTLISMKFSSKMVK